MKTYMLSLISLIFFFHGSFSSIAQDESGLGRVKRLNGIEAYIMSEPLRDYKVVFEVGGLTDLKSGIKIKSIATAGIVTEDISDKANQLATRVVEKATKDGHEVDAIVYTNAKTAVAIKFTDEPTDATKGIARVNKILGYEVYVFCEPLKTYKVIADAKGKSGKGTSLITGGIVNSSIEDDVNKLVEKLSKEARRKRHQMDAVVYSNGKSGIGVKFE